MNFRQVIQSLSCAILISGVAVQAQDNPRGEFYIKDNVKGFISLSGGFGWHSDALVSGVNQTFFNTIFQNVAIVEDTTDGTMDTLFTTDPALLSYSSFGNSALHGGIQVGAQYNKFLTWFDFSAIPTQVSPVPKAIKSAETFPYHRDMIWQRFNLSWMFGHEFLGGSSPLTFIPAAGVGFSEVNFRFSAPYVLQWNDPIDKEMEYYPLGDRYYSAQGKVLQTELETRLRFTKTLSLGLVLGAQFLWYDHVVFEESKTYGYILNVSEVAGSYYSGALRLTYTIPSVNDQKALAK